MNKKLVVYFSASGITAELSKRLVNLIGADLHEIVPKVPYTSEDLNWQNPKSRSSIEMKNRSFRPEIEYSVIEVEQYDIIYIGFPIWWYVAPTIVNTFLEKYDLNGKIIVPFATSGSSEMGDTNVELKPSCKGAILKDGKRFPIDISDFQLKSWADSFI